MGKAMIYSVPESIAGELNLTAYRAHDGKGHVLLSGRDLMIYGIEKAISEGAEELTAEEAKDKFNL